MSINSVEIEGLRSFASAGQFEPAVPNGEFGSGLTVFLGPNNGGKTTIVEAFASLTHPRGLSFPEGKRNKLAGDAIRIRVDCTEGSNELRTVAAGGCEASWTGDVLPEQLLILQSRRSFSHIFGKGYTERVTYASESQSAVQRAPEIGRFSQRLFRIQENKAEFDRVLARVLDPVPNWYIDLTEGGSYYMKVREGGSFHGSEGLGDGLVSILFIIDSLYDSEPGSTVVIDEPELSLHPSLQRKLSVLLCEYARDRQVIIATHSPYFLSWKAILSGGKIFRVVKQNHNTRLFSLSSQTVLNLRAFLDDQFNPHVLGLDAREIFFLDDSVILTEGQEDVIFYRRVADHLGIEIDGEFFGWGVGGADKMPLICRLLSELGFERVVGILDGNKAKVKRDLEERFPSYKFFVIPADDIRTKPPTPPRDGVRGLLDESRNIRDEHRDEMRSILLEINSWFRRDP